MTAGQHPGARRAVRRAVEALVGTDFDARLPPDRLAALAEALEPVRLDAGQVLFRTGDPGDGMYVVASGRVRVLVGEDGSARAVRELGRDQVIGEMALLTGEPRTATIVAVRDTELYRISTGGFERHLVRDPLAMRHLMVTLARRVQHTARHPTLGEDTVRTIAVVGAGDAPDARRFGAAVGAFLGRHGRAAVLTSQAIDAALGAGTAASEPSPRESDLVAWMHDAEDANDHVLYVADPEPTAWSRRCVRSADVVLLVGTAGSATALNAVERLAMDAAAGSRTRVALVIAHPSGASPPGGTSAWLAERPVERVHHVARDDDPGHLGRLARLLTGRAVGLVLSGGSVRGFAHIGVLRALRERRIPVDVVCATSAGALIGGQFAMGCDDRDLEQRNCAIFGGARRRILDYTFPVTSVVGSVRLNEKLGELFGDGRVEDTWLPLLCTVTDLTAGETRTYDRGLLRRVVRASCSMPIVFPPVVEAGHLLADGGILDNLPIGPLLERVDVGTLVVVDVTKPFQAAEGAYTYDDCLPLWRVLNGRFNPFATRLVSPGIVDVLLRAIEIGARSLDATQIERADIYVRPDFGDLSYTDTSRIPDAVRAGHDAALRLLDGWDPSGIPFR